MILLYSRILKYTDVSIDEEHKITIDGLSRTKPHGAQTDEPNEQSPDKVREETEKACKQMLAKANEQAKKIVANAEISGESITESARKDGYAAGYAEGHQQGLTETDALKADVEKFRQSVAAEKEAFFANVEPQLIDLVRDIVRKLLSDEVDIDTNVILYLIRKGLSAADDVKGDISIHVSAEDYETVQQEKDAFLTLTDASAQVEIVKDLSLHQSDCLIETSFGTIDCGLDQQYEALKKDLYFILKNR